MNPRIALTLLLAIAGVALLSSVAAAQTVEPGWIAAKSAAVYREAARYPTWSKVLPEGSFDPILEKHTPTRITASRDGKSLTVWGAEWHYLHGDPVDFFVEVEGGEPVSITGEVLNQNREVVGRLSFFDDGEAVDKSAADGVFSARVVAAKRLPRPELAENYMVKVLATFADGTSQTATTGFLSSRPWARLVGRYRDRVEDGNLVISARVRVRQAGRFHLTGTLTTLDGEPIGTAQTAVELEPGGHWIDLAFFGLMFHDRAVSGPFRLGSLAFSTTGAMPNAINDLVVDAHTTSPRLRAKSFRTVPFNEPGLLSAAAVLEAEAARARGALSER